jgi:hypothetical protein
MRPSVRADRKEECASAGAGFVIAERIETSACIVNFLIKAGTVFGFLSAPRLEVEELASRVVIGVVRDLTPAGCVRFAYRRTPGAPEIFSNVVRVPLGNRRSPAVLLSWEQLSSAHRAARCRWSTIS